MSPADQRMKYEIKDLQTSLGFLLKMTRKIKLYFLTDILQTLVG